MTRERDLLGVPTRLFPLHQIPGLGFCGLSSPPLLAWLYRRAAAFDVAHVHLGRDLVTLPAAAVVRQAGLPYLTQTHGMVRPSNHPLARPLDWAATRPLLQGAVANLVLTDQEEADIRFLVRDEGTVRLTNGVANATEMPARSTRRGRRSGAGFSSAPDCTRGSASSTSWRWPGSLSAAG